jgi:hypothetical protein
MFHGWNPEMDGLGEDVSAEAEIAQLKRHLAQANRESSDLQEEAKFLHLANEDLRDLEKVLRMALEVRAMHVDTLQTQNAVLNTLVDQLRDALIKASKQNLKWHKLLAELNKERQKDLITDEDCLDPAE